MKIRQGFVSNSSSSNFILAFDKKPNSVEELQKIKKWIFVGKILNVSQAITKMSEQLGSHNYYNKIAEILGQIREED